MYIWRRSSDCAEPSSKYMQRGFTVVPEPTFGPHKCRFHLGFSLVVCHPCIDGYRDFSLMRASSVVKRQSTWILSRFR